MNALTQLRPSNLILLAAAPFIIYLFATSSNYQRSLIAILGVEEEPLPLIYRYGALAAMCALGLVYPFHLLTRRLNSGAAVVATALAAVIAVMVAWQVDLAVFVNSAIANSVDPFNSPIIVQGVSPRQLTPEALAAAMQMTRAGLVVYSGFVLALLALAAGINRGVEPGRAAKLVALILATPSCLGLLYLLLLCPTAFAFGLFTTLRGAILAYVLAAVLGLTLAALQRLSAGQNTIRNYAVASGVLLVSAVAFFLQPHEDYKLVGNLTGKVAIVAGTPSSIVDTVRFGRYEGATATDVRLRTTATADTAIALMQAGAEVTAALLPAGSVTPDMPVLWQTSILPDRLRIPAISLGIAGLLLSLLTFGAWRHGLHPAAAGAEFFVDTIRGIPMLVIILYVGLPLGGSVREMTGGVIDLPNFTRGVIAMAIAYSAYLAEIFRAGIEAIPRGQIEAAKSLGMSGWLVGRRIIIPQAIQIVIPALSNEFIAILKDTSLLSILSVRDVTQRMREFQSASFLPFAPFNAAAILYVVLTLAAASALKSIERRYDVKHRR